MRRRRFIASLAAQSAVTALAAQAAADGADLVVQGASVRTMDSAQEVAEAFAVHGGRFVYVGSRAGARQFVGTRSEVLDLAGRTVLPGLVDSHLHLLSTGFDLHLVRLEGATSLEEVVHRTVAFAKDSPDEWVIGNGWDQNLWPGQAFPTHQALSAALAARPVLLYRIDGHALLANAAAMRAARVGASTVEPSGGRIERDASGEPTGVFIDNAMGLIERAVPAPTAEQRRRAARSAFAECHRWGVTSICEANTGAPDLETLKAMGQAGELDLRVYAMLRDDSHLLGEEFAHGPRGALYGGTLWVRAVKVFTDGALGSRGAALFEPYSDDPGNVGLLRLTPEHVADVAARAHAAGFQMCAHAIGDRANRLILDSYETALSARATTDHRWRIEHAQVLSQTDIPRFAKLRVIPSMQATHQVSDMPWAQERLGPARIKGAYAWRSLLDSGVIIANGTDSPVEPVNSLRTFHASISRQNERNAPAGGWYPAQRMTPEEALKSMTIWGAHASFREDVIGSIAPGKYADFVVMDRDWMTTAPEEIMNTRVLATYFGGRRVYDGTSSGHIRENSARRSASPFACACARLA